MAPDRLYADPQDEFDADASLFVPIDGAEPWRLIITPLFLDSARALSDTDREAWLSLRDCLLRLQFARPHHESTTDGQCAATFVVGRQRIAIAVRLVYDVLEHTLTVGRISTNRPEGAILRALRSLLNRP